MCLYDYNHSLELKNIIISPCVIDMGRGGKPEKE